MGKGGTGAGRVHAARHLAQQLNKSPTLKLPDKLSPSARMTSSELGDVRGEAFEMEATLVAMLALGDTSKVGAACGSVAFPSAALIWQPLAYISGAELLHRMSLFMLLLGVVRCEPELVFIAARERSNASICLRISQPASGQVRSMVREPKCMCFSDT
eukprot:274217-Chlamydomonas_euryale.AAC.4